MKKLIPAAFLSLVCISLVSCGHKEQSNVEPNNPLNVANRSEAPESFSRNFRGHLTAFELDYNGRVSFKQIFEINPEEPRSLVLCEESTEGDSFSVSFKRESGLDLNVRLRNSYLRESKKNYVLEAVFFNGKAGDSDFDPTKLYPYESPRRCSAYFDRVKNYLSKGEIYCTDVYTFSNEKSARLFRDFTFKFSCDVIQKSISFATMH